MTPPPSLLSLLHAVLVFQVWVKVWRKQGLLAANHICPHLFKTSSPASSPALRQGSPSQRAGGGGTTGQQQQAASGKKHRRRLSDDGKSGSKKAISRCSHNCQSTVGEKFAGQLCQLPAVRHLPGRVHLIWRRTKPPQAIRMRTNLAAEQSQA